MPQSRKYPNGRPTRTCDVCGASFVISKHGGKALRCSPECRKAARKARKAAWYIENIKERLAKAREWKAANPERVRATNAAFRTANPDYHREWRERNAELARLYNRRGRNMRRAREAAAPGTFTIDDWHRILDVFDHACAYCGRADVELGADHLIPLSRIELTPTNGPENIVPACRSCNSQKNAMLLSEWFPSLIPGLITLVQGRMDELVPQIQARAQRLQNS